MTSKYSVYTLDHDGYNHLLDCDTLEEARSQSRQILRNSENPRYNQEVKILIDGHVLETHHKDGADYVLAQVQKKAIS